MYPLKLFFRSPVVLVSMIVSFCLDITYFFWLLVKIGFRNERFFLHYNIISGIDWVGPSFYVYWIPIIGIFIILLNGVLAWYLYKDHRDLSYIVLAINILSHLCLGVATFMAPFLNI